MGKGFFGIKSTSLNMIAIEQTNLVYDINRFLKKADIYGLIKDPNFLDLISKMLKIDPKMRPSP